MHNIDFFCAFFLLNVIWWLLKISHEMPIRGGTFILAVVPCLL